MENFYRSDVQSWRFRFLAAVFLTSIAGNYKVFSPASISRTKFSRLDQFIPSSNPLLKEFWRKTSISTCFAVEMVKISFYQMYSYEWRFFKWQLSSNASNFVFEDENYSYEARKRSSFIRISYFSRQTIEGGLQDRN